MREINQVTKEMAEHGRSNLKVNCDCRKNPSTSQWGGATTRQPPLRESSPPPLNHPIVDMGSAFDHSTPSPLGRSSGQGGVWFMHQINIWVLSVLTNFPFEVSALVK